MSHHSSKVEVDRPLSPEEFALVGWLLRHGNGGNSEFLAQLQSARVSSLCNCGCASIDFSVSGQLPAATGMRTLSEYQWRNALGHLQGAYVFERNGLLAGLDLWSIDGQSTPDTLPPIDQLAPLGSPSQV